MNCNGDDLETIMDTYRSNNTITGEIELKGVKSKAIDVLRGRRMF